jgi:hypothetical protein
LGDAIFNGCFGVLHLISSRLISKGNRLMIVVYAIGILASLAYGYFVGREFNIMILII